MLSPYYYAMVFLEKKKLKGHTYWYASECRLVDGKIAKTYNQKYLVEDAFKLLNDLLLVPIGPINHHKDFNMRAHIF